MKDKSTEIIEEKQLFRRYSHFIKLYWFKLLVILMCSMVSMVSIHICIRAGYNNKTAILFLCLFGFVFTSAISFLLTTKIIKNAYLKSIFAGDVCFLVYFSLLFVSSVLFMILFLILEKNMPDLWFLKSTFIGILLMIIYWSGLAVLLVPNKISKFISRKQ